MNSFTCHTQRLGACLLAIVLMALPARAQEETPEYTIQVEPAELTLELGQTATLTAQILDAEGVVQEMPVMFFSRDRRSLTVDRTTGEVTAKEPGTFTILAGTFGQGNGRIMKEVTVNVPYPPIREVTIVGTPAQIYADTRVSTAVHVVDAADMVRDNAEVTFRSSDPAVASVDGYGNITARQPGTFTHTAEAEGVRGETTVTVVENPIERVELAASQPSDVRTGKSPRHS
jgi:uncharacterized protein YjdB